MKRSLLIICSSFLLLQACSLFKKKQEQPNVIIVNCHELSKHQFGCYNHNIRTTPTLDSLASHGNLFLNCISSSSSTIPSQYSLLYGKYAFRSRISAFTKADQLSLNYEDENIAKILSQNNYTTAAIGNWHLGIHPKNRATNDSINIYFKNLGFDHTCLQIDHSKCIEQNRTFDQLTDHILIEKTNEFIENKAGEPFFLWLSTGQKQGSKQLDKLLALLVENLENNDIVEETILIIVGDHGKHLENNGKRGGPNSPYQGGLEVPLIVSWPGTIDPTITNGLIQQVDLIASITSILNIDLKKSSAPDSQYLQALLLGSSDKGRTYSFSESYVRSYSEDGYKYIFPSKLNHKIIDDLTTDLGEFPNGALFHLINDPEERVNCIDSFQDMANKLHQSGLDLIHAGKSRPGAVIETSRIQRIKR